MRKVSRFFEQITEKVQVRHQELTMQRIILMRTATFTVTNSAGLHTRPAAKLVEVASKYKSTVRIGDQKMVDGKSILSLMMLAAIKGTQLKIEVKGPDEDRAIDALLNLINDDFGETA